MPGIWKSAVLEFLVLGVTLSVCLNLASGIKIQVNPAAPQVKGSVVLNVTEVTGVIRFSTWYKGQSTNASDQILNFFPPSTEHKGDKYFPEAKGQLNGSLLIINLKTDFSGFYTVQIQTDTLQQGSIQLTVNGAIAIVLSPLAPLLGMLLLSDLHFL